MIELDFTDGFTRMERALVAVARDQVPFAASRALNDCAKAAAIAVNGAMQGVFDHPTPFTERAAGIAARATKVSLAAEVTLRPIQAEYLLHEEVGGTRTPAENTRKKAKALLLPGRGIPLDRYGNIPAGTIARIKRDLAKSAEAAEAARQHRQEERSKGKRARSSAVPQRDRGVFYVPKAGHGQLVGGFYQRLPGHRLARLTEFKTETHYAPRLSYQARVEQAARVTWPSAFQKRLAEAVATRK